MTSCGATERTGRSTCRPIIVAIMQVSTPPSSTACRSRPPARIPAPTGTASPHSCGARQAICWCPALDSRKPRARTRSRSATGRMRDHPRRARSAVAAAPAPAPPARRLRAPSPPTGTAGASTEHLVRPSPSRRPPPRPVGGDHGRPMNPDAPVTRTRIGTS